MISTLRINKNNIKMFNAKIDSKDSSFSCKYN